MNSTCRVVVLPGTDGSGSLLDGFTAALDLPVTVLSYPSDEPLGYEDLARRLAPHLPRDEPYLLLGESFGGPLALMLAAGRPRGLIGLVLSASFVRYPVRGARALAGLASVAPVHSAPTTVLSWFLLGKWSTPEMRQRTATAVSAIAAPVLRARIAASLRIDATPLLRSLEVPLLYLRATRDRVVPRTASHAIQNAASNATVVEIDGPHFLLQAAPETCAQAVREFAARLTADPTGDTRSRRGNA